LNDTSPRAKENPFIFPVLAMCARTPTPTATSLSASSEAVGLSAIASSTSLWSLWRGGSCPVLAAIFNSAFERAFFSARSSPSPGVKVSPNSRSSSWVAAITRRASHFPSHTDPSRPIRDPATWRWSWSVSLCRTMKCWCWSGSRPILVSSARPTSCHRSSVSSSPAGRVNEQCQTGLATSGRNSLATRNSRASSRGEPPDILPPIRAAPGRGPFRSSAKSRYSARPRNPEPRLTLPFIHGLLRSRDHLVLGPDQSPAQPVHLGEQFFQDGGVHSPQASFVEGLHGLV